MSGSEWEWDWAYGTVFVLLCFIESCLTYLFLIVTDVGIFYFYFIFVNGLMFRGKNVINIVKTKKKIITEGVAMVLLGKNVWLLLFNLLEIFIHFHLF